MRESSPDSVMKQGLPPSYVRGCFLLCLLVLSGCSLLDDEVVLVTLEDAPNITIKTSVSGVGFDIPLNYFYRGYTKGYGWLSFSKEDIEGTRREEVDFLNLYMLYPDFSPATKENLKEFQVLGWGKRIMVGFTHFRQWGFDFNKSFDFDQSGLREEDPQVPGMYHYYWHQTDRYLKYSYNASHDRVLPDQTAISCDDQEIRKRPSPSCEVKTTYRPSAELKKLEGINADMVWELKYTFSASYLSEWQKIDAHLKGLFDQFLKNAKSSKEI